jgi:protein-disulfide isomerase
MFNRITWREFLGFAAAVAVVAFFVGRASRSVDYPTVHDESARAAVPVPAAPAAAAPADGPTGAPGESAQPAVPRPERPPLAPGKVDPAALRRVPPDLRAKAAAAALAQDPPVPVAPSPAAPAPAAEPPEPAVNFAALQPSPAIGPDAPLVTVVTCTDFQCPVCSRAAQEMRPVIEKYKDRVRFELRNEALEMHRNARRAAIAGLAAHRQGKFWHMHDEMFRQQRFLTDEGLEQIARTNGLNVEQYQDDIQDPALSAQVDAETALCTALGARGTPTFFVNGEAHVGWGSAFGFEHVIEQHLKRAEEELAAGTPRAELYQALVRKYASDPKKFEALMLKHVPADTLR